MSAVPGEHATQVVWPAVEKVPGPQVVQSVAGSESVSAVPASHAVHEVVVACAPGAHVAQVVVESLSWS